jgi:hypothetical protein
VAGSLIVEHGLLHQPRHHAGVGPAAGNSGRPGLELAAQLQQFFAHRIIGAVGVVDFGVVVKSRPRLIHRIKAQRIGVMGQLDDVNGAHIHGEIDNQGLPGTRREQGREDCLVVLPCDGFAQMRDALLFQ